MNTARSLALILMLLVVPNMASANIPCSWEQASVPQLQLGHYVGKDSTGKLCTLDVLSQSGRTGAMFNLQVGEKSLRDTFFACSVNQDYDERSYRFFENDLSVALYAIGLDNARPAIVHLFDNSTQKGNSCSF